MFIVLYVSVTNMIAHATLVTEHILFWPCIFRFLFSFLFYAFLVNIVNVILCNKCITIKNKKSESSFSHDLSNNYYRDFSWIQVT